MKGHAKWEYIIHITDDIQKNLYKVKTLKDSLDFATDWHPVFKSKRKQEAIELCNALNWLAKASNKVDKIDTKNYTFVKDGYGKWKTDSYKQDSTTQNLIEVIHRKNEEIEEIEKNLHNQIFETTKYKIIAKRLYDKLHSISEADLYWELIKEAEIGDEELCDMVRYEMGESK